MTLNWEFHIHYLKYRCLQNLCLKRFGIDLIWADYLYNDERKGELVQPLQKTVFETIKSGDTPTH